MSLAGRGIVITRPRELAQGLAALVEARGGRAFVFPAIEIEPLPAPPALARLAEYDRVIFVSPSSVRVAARTAHPWPPARAVAIGSGTRRELERSGAAAVLAPQGGADSEALLALPEMQRLDGERVLIVRGEDGRTFLGETLAQRGARVEYAACYRRTRPGSGCASLLDAARRGELHAVTVTSAQALDNFIALCGGGLARALPCFVAHERIARHARDIALAEVVVAGTSDEQMLERLVAYFHERH
jgi:uroporphyrinogen-III synthase